MKRYIWTLAIVLSALALSSCGHKLPAIPSTPTTIVDTNLRAVLAKAGGIVLAGSKVVSKASDLELAAFRQGAIPAPVHQQADLLFKRIATTEKEIADGIDGRVFTSWTDVRAKIDPFVDRIRDLVNMLSQAGPSWKDRLLDGLGYALTIFIELQSPGFAGGRL